MKIWPLLISIVFLVSPSLGVAQTAQTAQTGNPTAPVQKHAPSKDAHIIGFHVSAEGALRIIYSDGAEVEVPKESGLYAIGEQILPQEAFDDIQVADDRQHIGWLASYMICAQSYPCDAELVIYHSGHKLTHIRPHYGIMWRWKFLSGGEQVVAQYGFPHGGDPYEYILCDTELGPELARVSSVEKTTPNWAKELQRTPK
jgi:hypothetical protein